MNALVTMFCLFAAGVVIFYSVSCINRMTPKTHHGIRGAYTLIAVGAFGEIVAIFGGHAPGMAESSMVCGLGLLNFLDRRNGHRVPMLMQEEGGHDHP